MKTNMLEEVVSLAQQTGFVFVATADSNGMPHIAAAGKLAPAGKKNVTVEEWFCPGTIANLNENKSISIVVWSKESDNGFQLLGEVKKVQDLGMLDGYASALEAEHRVPQVDRQLLVEVQKILEFRIAPHTDIEDKL